MGILTNLGWVESSALVVGLGCCVAVFIQDLRNRWVHAAPLLGLLLAGLVFRHRLGFVTMLQELFANLVFLGIILGIGWVYMRLRHGARAFFNAEIGWGDVFLLAAVAAWLSPLGFALYFVSGVSSVLLGVLAMLGLGILPKDWPIPLAGLLGGYLILFLPMSGFLEELVWGVVA